MPAERRNELRLTLRPTPIAVRAALGDALRDLAPPDDDAPTVELVLAEVMNNVVEHACRGRPDGTIALRLRREGDGLRCRILDDGAPMPPGCPPVGGGPDPSDLPEGGFGWMLIRALARNFRYRRRAGWNCQSFFLPTAGDLQPG